VLYSDYNTTLERKQDMITTNRKATVVYYIAECPMCAHRYIWLKSDLRKRSHTCKCGYSAPPNDFEYEEEDEIILLFTEDGLKIIDE
jgi:predicted RNA-binding Zn-ribbon protein involved in translation (DUF1610 family)